MKKITTIFLLFIGISVFSQKFYTKTGITTFKASVAAFEPVEAENKSTSVLLKTGTGDIAALLFVSAFRFKVALMEEHFNENYMDVKKHPKATFKGKLTGFQSSEISTEKAYPLTGTLTVRGVSKEINTVARLQKVKDKIYLQAVLTVTPQDFEINIPSIVRKKIAKSIQVTLDYELVEKK